MKINFAQLLLLLAISSWASAEDRGTWLKKSPSEEWEESLQTKDRQTLDAENRTFEQIYDNAYANDPEIRKIAEAYIETCLLKVEQRAKKKILPNRGGEGVLTIQIRADGKLKNVEVAKTSGDQILDEAMKHAVYLASPFEPLPPEMHILDSSNSTNRHMQMDVKFMYGRRIGGYTVDQAIMR